MEWKQDNEGGIGLYQNAARDAIFYVSATFLFSWEFIQTELQFTWYAKSASRCVCGKKRSILAEGLVSVCSSLKSTARKNTS